jgi:tetratricopeptide (TPR) repeat protein
VFPRSIFILLFPFCFYGQTKYNDSLKQALKNTKIDTVKINLLAALSENYNWDRPDSALYFAEKAEALTKDQKEIYFFCRVLLVKGRAKYKLKKVDEALAIFKRSENIALSVLKENTSNSSARFKEIVAGCNRSIGNHYYRSNLHSEAIPFLEKACTYYQQANSKGGQIWAYGTLGQVYANTGKRKEAIDTKLKGLILCRQEKKFKDNESVLLGNLGLDYYALGDYEKSLDCHKQAYAIDSARKDENGMLRHISNMSNVYKTIGNISKALEILFFGLKTAEKNGDKFSEGSLYDALALCYAVQSQNSDAINYYTKCVQCYAAINDSAYIYAPIGNIGLCYTEKADSANIKGNTQLAEKYNRIALEHFNFSIKLGSRYNDESNSAFNLEHIAGVYKANKELKKSLQYAKASIALLEKYDEKFALAAAYSNIASTYTALKDYLRAENYLNRSLKLSLELSSEKDLMYCYHDLYTLYKATGRQKKALSAFESYIRSRDSVRSDQNSKVLVKQQLKFEYDKQAAADSVAHAKENEIKSAELRRQSAEIKAKKNQQYALFGGLGLVMIFAGFMYNRFKVTQKQKGIIEQQKEIVEEQKSLVEAKQLEILDSIRYAKRIQTALLPSEKYLQKNL